MHRERRGEPLRLHQDVSATRLPGGLETTLQVTSKRRRLELPPDLPRVEEWAGRGSGPPPWTRDKD